MDNRTPQYETNPIFTADKRALFLLLCAIAILLLYIKKTFIENETAAFEFLLEQPGGGVLQVINGLQLILVPVLYLLKCLALGTVLWIGCFLFGYRITFTQCWGVVLVGEYVFLVPEVIKIIWFMFIETDPNIFRIRAFYPLAAINLVDYSEIPQRWIYPLKAINLFEVINWIVLYRGLTFWAVRKKSRIWLIIALFHIPIMVGWLLFYAIVYH